MAAREGERREKKFNKRFVPQCEYEDNCTEILHLDRRQK